MSKDNFQLKNYQSPIQWHLIKPRVFWQAMTGNTFLVKTSDEPKNGCNLLGISRYQLATTTNGPDRNMNRVKLTLFSTPNNRNSHIKDLNSCLTYSKDAYSYQQNTVKSKICLCKRYRDLILVSVLDSIWLWSGRSPKILSVIFWRESGGCFRTCTTWAITACSRNLNSRQTSLE